MPWSTFRSCVSHLSAKDQKRIERAFHLGEKAHGEQKRMSGEPYFSHPIAVSQILAEMGADPDTIIAALLHDTVEDTPLTLEDIEEEFGESVTALIDGVTKLSEEDVKLKPKEDEQIETLRKMFTLMQEDIRIMVIKLADRLHNMRTAKYLPTAKRNALARETQDVYVKIADRLSMQLMRNDLEGLCLESLKPALFKELQAIRKKNKDRGEAALKKMDRAIRKLNGSFPKATTMLYEPKSWQKVQEQFSIQEGPVTGVSSITVVFVCPAIADCFQVMGILHQLWKRESLSFQDFINSPRINGYRGLHTTIILENGTRVRCKIRTQEMQEYAQAGVTKHCFDSKAAGFMSYIKWAQRIAPLSEDTVERSEDFWESLKSDILGESILVHGPGDHTMQIPKNATALDGVFYFFGEEGLKTKEIFINGTPVKFYEELPFACSIAANFASSAQTDLSWLQYVNTGIASALIHKGLAKAPRAKKQEYGKKLLDQSLKKHSRVGIHELTTQTLERIAKKMGPRSVAKLFEQIAEGKIDAEKTALLLSPKHKNGNEKKARKRRWAATITYPLSLAEEVTKVLRTFRPEKLLFKVKKNREGKIQARYSLTFEEQQALHSALNTILHDGKWALRPVNSLYRLIGAFLLLLALWGLDPVVAGVILQHGLSAVDLTQIRFITLFVCAAIVFALQSLIQRKNLKPLSPFDPWLLVSAIALFSTALCTYLALSAIPASQYILFIIAGIVFSAIIECVVGQRDSEMRDGRKCIHALGSFVLIVAGILCLAYLRPIAPLHIFYASVSGIGFAIYSQASELFLRKKAMVTARYPAFLFWLSFICLLFAASLTPFHTMGHFYSMPLVWEAVLFVLTFNAIPYFLFFEISRRVEGPFIDNALPFVYIATAIGETLTTGSHMSLIILPLMLVFFWQFAHYLQST